MLINAVISMFRGIRDSFVSIEDDDRGIGVVEVILIMVVLIGLVVIFRDQLTNIINGIFVRITEDVNAI